MNIQELTESVRRSSQKFSAEDRDELLRKAHILDKNGFYDKRFFSAETVRKDRDSSGNIS